VEALEEAQDKKDLPKVGQRVCALEDAIAKLEAKVTAIENPRCSLAVEVGTSKQKINTMADALAKLEAKVASPEKMAYIYNL
jgi:septal ring factor EnvC (AmiA/AmiB activator)